MWFEDILACPDCSAPLRSCACSACDFGRERSSRPDLRPRQPKPVSLTFKRTPFAPEVDIAKLQIDPPIEKYTRVKARRDSSELIGAILPDLRVGARVLDLGCGPRDQAPVFESLGVNYVGVDYDGGAPDLLCDAHCLPFKSNSFDVVFSYAVLEHLANPFIAIGEISRVLANNGVFCGTVSQGEPFHNSFFHQTSWGLLSLAHASTLRLERIWPSSEDTLRSLATMGRYPKPVRLMIEAVNQANSRLPFLSPRKYFSWPVREKTLDRIHRAGSLCFVFRK